ncbi:hypothetical protein BKM17_12455 [Pseudomonas syringae group genomosp. 3]|nr:hypothetical protein BKM17_12455 [Pseudomonas syringae group genomosp. 3]
MLHNSTHLTMLDHEPQFKRMLKKARGSYHLIWCLPNNQSTTVTLNTSILAPQTKKAPRRAPFLLSFKTIVFEL